MSSDESDKPSEHAKLERRVCQLEYWARELAEHLYEYHGVIIEAPDPEEREEDDERTEDD